MSTHEKAAPARSAKEQFDRQASHYDTQWNTWSQESLAWMLAHAGVKPTDAVLDVATGSGFTALAFAREAAEVVGSDVSSGMLDEARKRAAEQGLTNAEFVEAPAENLPFPDGRFDIVTCRIAAHHFLDIRRFVAETARVLKPGGRFILADTSVPDGDPEASAWQNEIEAVRDPSHVQNYTPGEWRAMVEDAGLTVLESGDTGGGITIPASDWIRKAGCAPEQSERVYALLRGASGHTKQVFQVEEDSGEITFTWKRVVLAAVK